MIKPLEHILNVPVYKPGKPIEEVKRELGLDKIIKLASNENPFGCSLFVKKAVEEEVVNINRYPDGGGYYLKKAISRFLEIDEGQIILGNGSNDILDMIARAFLDKNSEAIMFEHSFIVYKIVSMIQGANVKEVPVECDFSRNLENLLKNITDKTKVIFIDNPCNPTGIANKKEEFDEFIKNIPDNVLVVIDEAYFEYAKGHSIPDGINYVNIINPKIPQKNVIVTRTFSKAYGLAGLRVGYAVAQKEIIDILERVRQPFNVNRLAQVAAIEALKDQKFVEYSVKENEKGKEFLYEEFEKRGIHFVPSYANFIMFKVNNAKEVYELLLKKGVVVRPAFGLENYLRVSIGTMEENQKFVDALDSLGFKCKV